LRAEFEVAIDVIVGGVAIGTATTTKAVNTSLTQHISESLLDDTQTPDVWGQRLGGVLIEAGGSRGRVFTGQCDEYGVMSMKCGQTRVFGESAAAHVRITHDGAAAVWTITGTRSLARLSHMTNVVGVGWIALRQLQ